MEFLINKAKKLAIHYFLGVNNITLYRDNLKGQKLSILVNTDELSKFKNAFDLVQNGGLLVANLDNINDIDIDNIIKGCEVLHYEIINNSINLILKK